MSETAREVLREQIKFGRLIERHRLAIMPALFAHVMKAYETSKTQGP